MPRHSFFSAPRFIVDARRVIRLEEPRAAIPRRIKRRFECDDESSSIEDECCDERSSMEDERTRGGRGVVEARVEYGQSRRAQIAKAFLDLNLTVARNFEAFAKLISETRTVHIVRDWLEHVIALTSSADGGNVEKKCPKMLLSAYMIQHHSDVVIGGRSEEERTLIVSSCSLIDALEATTAAAANCASLQSLSALAGEFERRWCLFTADWKIWKTKDAISLRNELMRIGVAMETSMLRVCGPSALDDAVDLGEERNAIRDAQIRDRELLRGKILMISGQEAAESFDDMIEEARYSAMNEISEKSHSSDAQKAKLESRRMAREAMSEHMAEAITSDKERAKLDDEANPASVELQKEQILHELMLDADWKLTASRETSDPMRDAFEEAMTRAFWDLAYESLVGGSVIDASIVRTRIIEWKDAVIDDALSFDDLPTSQLETIESLLTDIDIEKLISGINQMEHSPLAACSALHLALERGCDVLRALCTEDETVQLEAERAHLIAKIESSNQEKESIARNIISSLGFLFTFRERLSKARYLKAANAAIDGLRLTLARGDVDGFDYARERFLHRFSVQPGDECSLETCTLKFPRTCAWLEAVADDLPSIDAQFTTSGPIIGCGDTWRGIHLRSGLMSSDIKENVRRQVVDTELKPVAVMTVEGVSRIALVKLISNRHAIVQEFYPETLEFDLQRLRTMWNDFAVLHVLASCAALSRQLGNGSTGAVVHRVALLITDTNIPPDFEVIARIIRQNAPNNRDEESTIVNVLRQMCSVDNPLASAVVNALRSALIVRILFGFEDPRTDARVEVKLATFADAARPLRERVDALARAAAPLHNLSSRVHANILSTLAADVISRVDDEI